MPAAGTRPRTPIAVLATTEESLRSSMTGAMLTEGGKDKRRTSRSQRNPHVERESKKFADLENIAASHFSSARVLCSGSITVDSVVAVEEEVETAVGWRSPETTEIGPSQRHVTNALNSESELLLVMTDECGPCRDSWRVE